MRSTIKHRMAHLERTIHAGLSAPGDLQAWPFRGTGGRTQAAQLTGVNFEEAVDALLVTLSDNQLRRILAELESLDPAT